MSAHLKEYILGNITEAIGKAFYIHMSYYINNKQLGAIVVSDLYD